MIYTTLISRDELLPNIHHPNWAIIDCRFSLEDAGRGRRDYLHSHIAGAIYAHLNEDLCGSVVPGVTGRHPLPTVEQLAERFSSWGIDERVQVVAYDDWIPASGAVAARLWWSLRWLGHQAVAVLDGGWAAWQEAGLPAGHGVESRLPRTFVPRLRPELLASSEEVNRRRQDQTWMVFDSRLYDRYRGENETIDPVAGHIPGAKSAPYIDNAAPGGNFLPAEALNKRFKGLLGGVPAERAVFYCGSGVTAAHNLLAMTHAGIGEGRLYVGSWSEWITDPRHPVCVGDEREA